MNLLCPACVAKRQHTEAEWLHHPNSRHGFTREGGETKPVTTFDPKEPVGPKSIP